MFERLPGALCIAGALLVAYPATGQAGKSACVRGGGYDSFPFCNTSLDLDSRVWDLVKRIKDEDKPELLTARGHLKNRDRRALPYLGVPSYYWGSNCIHSSMFSNCTKDGRCSTSFPSGPSMAATFDRNLIRTMAGIVGVETRAGFNMGDWVDNGKNGMGLDCWGPVINQNRDPRWGRNGEGGAEDPYLLGELAKAWTLGLQNGSDPRYVLVAITLKHFVGNSVEGDWVGPGGAIIDRHTADANLSNYMLSDSYYPAYREGIKAGARGIMCSYNAVNGIPTCLDPLQRAAREAWGFRGYVTSDSDSVSDAYKKHMYAKDGAEASCLALKRGGCDVDSGNTYYDNLADGLSRGECSSDDVDRALFNTMRVRFELGLFDPIDDQPYWRYNESDIGTDASRELNQRAAAESLVLMANPPRASNSGAAADANVLPFAAGTKVAVIGPHGNASFALIQVDTGRICASGGFDCFETPLDSIKRINQGGSVTFTEGVDVLDMDAKKDDIAAAVDAARAADVVVLGVGIINCGSWWGEVSVASCGSRLKPIDQYTEGETHDRKRLDLPPAQKTLIDSVLAVGKPTAAFVLNGGAVDLTPLLSPTNTANRPAVIEAFYPGQEGGGALASAIFGKQNRWGKLPYTVYTQAWAEKFGMLDMDEAATQRTYRYAPSPEYVVAPFGFGMSYTSFQVSATGGALSLQTDGSGPAAKLAFSVENTGPVRGDEVVQLYLVPTGAALDPKPAKSLIGFQRIADIAAGATVQGEFSLVVEDVLLVAANGDRVAAPGKYTLSLETGAPGAKPVTIALSIEGKQVVYEPFPNPS